MPDLRSRRAAVRRFFVESSVASVATRDSMQIGGGPAFARNRARTEESDVDG